MQNKNQIYIRDYTLWAKHGYYKEEHEKKQRFVVNVLCDVEENKSGINDNLKETFNYEIIRQIVHDVISNDGKSLLESLAHDISNLILKHKIVISVEVDIHKPDIWGDCNPGVKIIRYNESKNI